MELEQSQNQKEINNTYRQNLSRSLTCYGACSRQVNLKYKRKFEGDKIQRMIVVSIETSYEYFKAPSVRPKVSMNLLERFEKKGI